MEPNRKITFRNYPTFIDDSTSVLIERDAILKNVMKIGVCEQTIYAEEVGAPYEYDLNTGIRKLQDYKYYDLCNGTETIEGEEVSKVGSFQDFFSYTLEALRGQQIKLSHSNHNSKFPEY